MTDILAEGQISLETVEDGDDGKSAYEYATDAEYPGTPEQFSSDLADVSNKLNISDFEDINGDVTTFVTRCKDSSWINSHTRINVQYAWGRTNDDGSPDFTGDVKKGQLLAITIKDVNNTTTIGTLIVKAVADSTGNAVVSAKNISYNHSSQFMKWDATNGLYITNDAQTLDNAVRIDADSVDIIKGDQTVAEYSQGLRVWSDDGTEITHLGYGTTQGQSGETDAPYYDLGVRKANTTKGAYSVAEGYNTTASGYASHAEGYSTTANSHHSHAEGDRTIAWNYSSHAEGTNTRAGGDSSHAEGLGTTAMGMLSHAEGDNTTASGFASHVEGIGTIASGAYSHVQGTFNVEDTNDTYADIVGNGDEDDNRSNAYALDRNGNGRYKGDVYIHCKSDSSEGKKLEAMTTDTVTSSNETASANSSKTIAFSVAKTGYTPIGIVGVQNDISTTYCPISSFRISGSNARIVLRNLSSNAQSGTITVTVLYKAN